MTEGVLKAISDALATEGIEYGFGTYNKEPIVYPYFVGSYMESEPFSEDGLQTATFTLTGFSRSTWATLETAKGKIQNLFSYFGKTFTESDGSAAVIAYSDSQIIPTGDAELKSIAINLSVKEWKVI